MEEIGELWVAANSGTLCVVGRERSGLMYTVLLVYQRHSGIVPE